MPTIRLCVIHSSQKQVKNHTMYKSYAKTIFIVSRTVRKLTEYDSRKKSLESLNNATTCMTSAEQKE